ncbi:MAG TPA: polyprenol monophosphomannose synthase [Dyella sp.]|uniref:polyprenol monophosphomannose synthase n=1 Tax=Dyella sp. TaxID=1869338 RepID=UPI002C3A7D4F|nr:polyprenol monophosphomannose synthase [Dyella sp.]HTV84720.1 polyprenol monophosphomannose synthase [Dyella sp.]
MTKLLVFFATYNEAGNAEPLLSKITSVAPEADILVVDDNSSDGTVEVMQQMHLPQLTIINRKGKLGLGTAHLLALAYARHHGYDIVVTMDGDLSHDPADLPALTCEVAKGSDIGIGSRYMSGGTCDYSGYRLYVSKLGNIVARCLLGLKLHEFTTSFRAFKVDSLQRVDFSRLLVGGYSFFLTMIAEASSRGLLITETPIHFHERGYGVSKIPTFEAIRGIVNLVRLAWIKVFVRKPPAPAMLYACPACKTAYTFVATTGKHGAQAALTPAGTCVLCGYHHT